MKSTILTMSTRSMDTMRQLEDVDGTKLLYWVTNCGVESAPTSVLKSAGVDLMPPQ
jgi:hypothetical protein